MPEPLFTRRFLALWFFQCATFFSAFQLLPVIPLRIVALGGDKSTAGTFLFVYTLSSAFAAPIMGTVADHVGRKRMLVTASLLFVVFSLAYGVVPWLPLVLLIAVVHGALWSSILSAAGAIMTDFIPPSRRTEGLAYWGLAPTAAIALAPAIGMYVNRWFGWLALCAEIATLSALTAVWGSRLPGAEKRDAARPFPRPHEFWDFKVLAATLSLAVVAFGYGGTTSYVALLSRERGIQPESLFFTAFALGTICVRVFTARLGDRYGPKVLLYPSFVAMPIAFAILARAENRVTMSVAGALFGMGLGLAFPAFMTFVMAHTPDDRRARTFGSIILGFDTGIGVGSMVIGAIGQRAGLGTAFTIAAGIACLSIPIFLVTSRRLSGVRQRQLPLSNGAAKPRRTPNVIRRP
ncbi:MAG TPA: MFS transporter [Thermoanaerobaculia bacterium]|nr:MFS transporter [Thermoanaerobaculia bacterium]